METKESEEQDSILGIDSVYQDKDTKPQQQQQSAPTPRYAQLVRLYPVLTATRSSRGEARPTPTRFTPVVYEEAFQSSTIDHLAAETEWSSAQNQPGVRKTSAPLTLRESRQGQTRQTPTNVLQRLARDEDSSRGILVKRQGQRQTADTATATAELPHKKIITVLVIDKRCDQTGRKMLRLRQLLTPEQLAEATRLRKNRSQRLRNLARTAAELAEIRERSRQRRAVQMQDPELRERTRVRRRELNAARRRRLGLPTRTPTRHAAETEEDKLRKMELDQGMERRLQLYMQIKSGEISKEEGDKKIEAEVREAVRIGRARISHLPFLLQYHRRKATGREESAKPKNLPPQPIQWESNRNNLPWTPTPCQLCSKSVPFCYMHLHLQYHRKEECDQDQDEHEAQEAEEQEPIERGGVDGAEYKCDACEKMFGEEFLLKMHWGQAHESPAVVKCSICDKEFRDKATMNKHTTKAHVASITG